MSSVRRRLVPSQSPILLILLLLLLALFTSAVTNNNVTVECQQYTGSCTGCVDYIAGDSCIYCTSTGICSPSSTVDDYCSPSDQSHSCSTSYYTIIFVIVICSLFCLCLGTCWLKRVRTVDGNGDGILAPLLPEMARNFLWRNSLLTEGELEWMCIICGFDNKPRNAHCNMCGTSHEFTIEYKSEKKVEKARAKEARNKDREREREKEKEREREREREREEERGRESDREKESRDLVKVDAEENGDDTRNPVTLEASPSAPLSPPHSLSTSTHRIQSPAALRELLSANSDAPINVNANSSINAASLGVLQSLLAFDAANDPSQLQQSRQQLGDAGEDVENVWHASSNDQGFDRAQSLSAGGVTQRLSFSSPSRHSVAAMSLSHSQRQEAFNYRRLNQLSLRQKSARRRRMWQRVVDADGMLKWVRAPPQSTMVGEAPFGYTPSHTPGNSEQSSSDLSMAADSHLSAQARGGRFSNFSFRSLLGRRKGANRQDRDQEADALTASLLGSSDRKAGSRDEDSDRASSPATSRNLSSGHPRTRSDSFGDSVVMSGSPGFTSIFCEDEEAGWGLRWEKVESGAEARRSSVPSDMQSGLIAANNAARGMGGGGAGGGGGGGGAGAGGGERAEAAFDFADQDLVAVAALQFKEKQLWFLDAMSKLQRPWGDGAIRLEVRRGEFLLDDSVRQFADLRRADLHKWMRVQFVGEPGIDAGGLEREWFSLATQDLFAHASGLFTCSSGDALGGTYHINPTSGAAKLDHLKYFRFAGKLLGKALMEQQVVPATLSLPLRKQILSLPITFSDLEFVDPQLHRNLKWLDSCPDLSTLCLDFTVNYPSVGGSEIFELKTNGAECAVTSANKEEYLLLRLRNRMLDSVKAQLEALLCGLYEVVPPDLLSVFDYQELELLLCGVPDIDLDDWRRHTEYLSDYTRLGARHRVIRWFWAAIEAMTREERVRLLQFTTGCSRLPAQGFKALQSNDGNYRKFNIQAISKRDSLYPRAHTCFNKLDLPLYDSQAELEAYLSVVVNAEISGFTME